MHFEIETNPLQIAKWNWEGDAYKRMGDVPGCWRNKEPHIRIHIFQGPKPRVPYSINDSLTCIVYVMCKSYSPNLYTRHILIVWGLQCSPYWTIIDYFTTVAESYKMYIVQLYNTSYIQGKLPPPPFSAWIKNSFSSMDFTKQSMQIVRLCITYIRITRQCDSTLCGIHS